MLIKFKKPDPRAGTTVRMDSSRGQHFVDIGSAVKLKESGEEDAASEPEADEEQAETSITDENAAEVIAWAGEERTAEELQAALDAENAGKGRKTVVEALEAAISKAGEG